MPVPHEARPGKLLARGKGDLPLKVLFYSANPFFLAHGGTQTLLEALMREIAGHGVTVEPARWWDDGQTGDILHFMNRPTGTLVRCARQKGFKTVMTENIDQTASRSAFELWFRRAVFGMDKVLGGRMGRRLGLEVYQMLDAAVYAVELERQVAQYLYAASAAKCHVVPHGIDAGALADLSKPAPEGDYLVSIATIIPRKNTVLLAKAARLAHTPVVFLGKPFSEDDSYYREFLSLVDGQWVRYPGFVSSEEKHRLLREARGFALLSQFESGCIAVHEAAAAGLPLFLPSLPWASQVYGRVERAYIARLGGPEAVAPALRSFYGQAHRLKAQTFPVLSWSEVARKYVSIYEGILG